MTKRYQAYVEEDENGQRIVERIDPEWDSFTDLFGEPAQLIGFHTNKYKRVAKQIMFFAKLNTLGLNQSDLITIATQKFIEEHKDCLKKGWSWPESIHPDNNEKADEG